MRDLTVTLTCEPGQATPERALDFHQRVVDLLTAIADDIKPGAVTFVLCDFQWIDDGKDEIVVSVTLGASDVR